MSTTIDSTTAEQLLRYLAGARWFAGKGRAPELVGLTPLPWLSDAGTWPAVRFEVAEIRYQPTDGESAGAAKLDSTELYQLALSYWPEPQPDLAAAEIGQVDDAGLGAVLAYDAMADPAACRVVLDRMLAAGEVASDGSRVGFHLVSVDALSPDLEPRLYTGQQSNTSVMYGDVAMLKLFRRLEVGHNLDIEVHESLSRSGVKDVARLFGYIDGSWRSSAAGSRTYTADLAMVVEKLAEAEDGWGLALGALRSGTNFVEQARALGRSLADIHEALRAQFPAAEVDGGQVAQVMTRRLSTAARIAPALDPYQAGLARCFTSLSEATLTTQRVHGDFHLGQTLSTPGGWKIIDFEGEPVKSLAERAAPDSVWRDIAGMLRSFDYAAASVPGPDSQTWAESCRDAFLEGYAGGRLSAADESVLRAYLADKAVYEVVYEVRNRPDWVGIPLRAVEAIASAQPTTSATAEEVKE